METSERKLDLNRVAEIKLSNSGKVKASERPKVTCSRQVLKYFPRLGLRIE